MHTSTSGSISASEQGKDCTRFDPLLTATDRNSVFFRCSCVFFVSRETSRSIQEFERRDSRIALNRATDTALARLGSPMYALQPRLGCLEASFNSGCRVDRCLTAWDWSNQGGLHPGRKNEGVHPGATTRR